MDDHVRSRLAHGLDDLVGIERVRDHRHRAQLLEHRLLRLVTRHAVHLMTGGDQSRQQLPPDRSGRSRHEHPHRQLLDRGSPAPHKTRRQLGCDTSEHPGTRTRAHGWHTGIRLATPARQTSPTATRTSRRPTGVSPWPVTVVGRRLRRSWRSGPGTPWWLPPVGLLCVTCRPLKPVGLPAVTPGLAFPGPVSQTRPSPVSEGRTGEVATGQGSVPVGCHRRAPRPVAKGEDGCDPDDRDHEGTRV
jgi:hypothetical protein